MPEPTFTEAELRLLRQAVERGDVNACRAGIYKLLLELPAGRALRLVRDFVARRLPVFERHQPGVHWPRQFIESTADVDSTGDARSWPEAESDFPGPGANNFTNAVQALWEASHHMEEAQSRCELLADAIVGVIVAERLEYWGALHPEEWARWYQLASSGSSDVSRFEILVAAKRDPEAARVEKEAWLEVALRLEEELGAAEQG